MNTRNKRLYALAVHLGIDTDDIKPESWDSCAFDAGGLAEYLVLDDAESNVRAEQYIRESVWAFNASFLQGYGAFKDLGYQDIQRMQESCESVNPAFVALIGDDWDGFISDAFDADGRGHFMNTYDGQEHEIEYGGTLWFIYRKN